MELEGIGGVITGAAGGIGRAIADDLLSRGVGKVGLLVRNDEQLESMREELSSKFPDARVFPMLADVRDPEGLMAVFDKFKSECGSLDFLINNASVLLAGPVFALSFKGVVKYPLSSWQETLDSNVTGAFLCSQTAVELMVRGRTKGIIINISSIARAGQAGQVAYSASKGAVASMTASLAQELRSYGIRCCAIAPGIIDTPMARRISEEHVSETISRVAAGRMGMPEEVALAVRFCIENEYFNGRVLELDGGAIL
jgi:3-oxoacyl-[acyl-carrier protein] reductase